MKMDAFWFRWIVQLVAWAIIAVTVAGLFTGAAWLDLDVGGMGLALGGLATAAVFVLLPTLAFAALKPGSLRAAAGALIVCGVLWLPVSAWLAGNYRLNFSAVPDWWWPVTLGLPCASLLLWLWIAVRAVVLRLRGADRRDG